MKRILIVAFCVAFAVCLFAVPASASTYEERWTNVLDYTTVNDSGSNFISLSSGESFSFTMSGRTIIQDIDIVFRSSHTINSIKAVRQGGMTFNLQLTFIGSGIYRAYGNLQGYAFDTLGFEITFSSGEITYGEVLQCRISSQTVDFYNVSASITKDISVTGPNSHFAASDSTAFSFTETGDWFISFSVSDWKKFDFIDFAFTMNGISIGSISAKIGDRSIPVNIESFDGDPYGSYQKMLTGYLDIYGVDHEGANTLELYITGTCTSVSGASLWLGWLNGSVKVESPSIFALIWQSIKDGFKAVGNWLSNGFNSVVNAITGSFDGLKQEQSDTNDKIDSIINDTPTVSTPEGGEIITDIIESEQQVVGSVNSGKDVFADSVDQSIDVLFSRATAFAFFVWIFGLITRIKFISDLLYFSLGVGAFGLLISLTATLGRNITKSGSKSD